jgi:hypothetical protein
MIEGLQNSMHVICIDFQETVYVAIAITEKNPFQIGNYIKYAMHFMTNIRFYLRFWHHL